MTDNCIVIPVPRRTGQLATSAGSGHSLAETSEVFQDFGSLIRQVVPLHARVTPAETWR